MITDSASAAVLDLSAQARLVGGDADLAIALAVALGRHLPLPGGGHTADRWRTLTELSAADLTCGRVAEAHLDAIAILSEAGMAPPDGRLAAIGAGEDSSWGVFAAEAQGMTVQARAGSGSGWRLTGTKPWCSLADRLSHALITAHTDRGRRLFAVALRGGQVRLVDQTWVSRGLAGVPSGPIELLDAVAVPVGGPDWYLRRPGFAWGGMGVAACWCGGLVGLARSLFDALARRDPDPLGRMLLGQVDLELQTAAAALAAAAVEVDAGRATGRDGELLAARVRALVAGGAEAVLRLVGHALGPAPLTQQEEHARRVADLTVYIRQHHAERDLAALGGLLLAGPRPW